MSAPARSKPMPALSQNARTYIKGMTDWNGGSIAGYTRHWFPDGKWAGDSCGCVDDRCQGHHHGQGEACHCIEGWVDEYLAAITIVTPNSATGTAR